MKTIPENWADLPPDLLQLILAKLSDICDYIRLPAVCKSWRCSISVSDLPPQFPWIIKLGDNKGSLFEFYSFTSKKVYTMLHSSNSSNKSLDLTFNLVRQFGSDDLFSLVRYKQSCRFHEGYCSFLNPINNSEVYVPVVHDPKPSRFPFCWSCPTSFLSEKCVIFSYGINQLAVFKSDGDKWNCVGGDLGYEYAYLNGFLFMNESLKFGLTTVIDIGTHQEVYVIPPPKMGITEIPFLVESSGEILLVCYIHTLVRDINNDYTGDSVYKFYIYRLEFGNGEGKPCWVTKSIRDQMLFIDFFAGRAFSLKAGDFPGFNGNSIYFINTPDGKIHTYNMESGKTISVNCPLNRRGLMRWFLPTLKPCLTSMFY